MYLNCSKSAVQKLGNSGYCFIVGRFKSERLQRFFRLPAAKSFTNFRDALLERNARAMCKSFKINYAVPTLILYTEGRKLT